LDADNTIAREGGSKVNARKTYEIRWIVQRAVHSRRHTGFSPSHLQFFFVAQLQQRMLLFRYLAIYIIGSESHLWVPLTLYGESRLKEQLYTLAHDQQF